VDGLELEFTEETLMPEGESTRGRLIALQQHGIHIAVDDFGTGYSNLARLRQIPATSLKIDQSFVRTLAHNPQDAILVRTITTMARDLGLPGGRRGRRDARDPRRRAGAGL